MKKKELEQIKNKVDAELMEELKKKRERLWNLQVDLHAGKVKNVREVRALKRAIAVIHTTVRERALKK